MGMKEQKVGIEKEEREFGVGMKKDGVGMKERKGEVGMKGL